MVHSRLTNFLNKEKFLVFFRVFCIRKNKSIEGALTTQGELDIIALEKKQHSQWLCFLDLSKATYHFIRQVTITKLNLYVICDGPAQLTVL